MAAGILLCCFGYFFWISTTSATPNPEVKMTLVSITMLIVGYYFGSSSSSKTKDNTISEILHKGTGTGDITVPPVTTTTTTTTESPNT